MAHFTFLERKKSQLWPFLIFWFAAFWRSNKLGRKAILIKILKLMWQLQHDVSNAFGGQFFLFAIGFFAALVFGGFFIASLGREQIKAHLPIMLLMGTLLLVMFGFPIFKSFQRKSFLEKGAFSEEIGLIEHYFEPTGKGRSWRSITFQVKGKPFELKKSLGSVYVGNGDSVKIHHHEGLVLRVWTYK